MTDRMSLREWIKRWDDGEFLSPDFETQCKAGWYDWFCSTESLVSRLKKMANKVKQIAKSDKINIDKMYVFFKNNSPMWTGRTYDDFRICDLDPASDKMFTIIPHFPKVLDGQASSFHMKCENVSEVFDCIIGDTVVSGTWKDVLNYFGV